MITGILAGVTWALETVILGIALGMSPLVSTEQAIFLAPFVSTFLHDACSALFMVAYNLIRGKGRELLGVFKRSGLKWLILASAIGGPIGMTGYALAVNHMGASVGAVASAVYPAIGTVLAYIFLKESVKWYQWIFLICTLLGVYGLSYSPGIQVENFWLGLLGAFMCAFGWGIEAVILAKCLKDPSIKNEYALNIRQMTSALIYGLLIIPVLGGWKFTAGLFTGHMGMLLITVAIAALFATVSYLFYYKTIAKVGASKAMALNITYTAWAIVFTVIILRDLSVLNPFTLLCAAVVVVCGILAATDIKVLLEKRKKG
ncbi:MAG: DMT family transporter [Clostridia bacterium]|nr:DMT family transporter [Clostridia bacterium]MBQ2255406.1 DMT family transporter [Clostridia bacterium]MBQ5794152.1 DMT family transporter [Clostridia bacterium]